MAGHVTRSLGGCALLATLGGGGCNFDAGHDYAVVVPWLINGRAPSRDLCESYGVSAVRFTVSTSGRDRTTTMPCDESLTLADGNDYGGFVSNVAFDYDVIYSVVVEMLDAKGQRQDGLFYKDALQVFYGDELPWVLRPLELLSPLGNLASVSASWDVGGGDLAVGCAEERIDTVVLRVTSWTDPDFVDATEVANAPCVDGQLLSDAPVLAEGDYLFKYVALDARGAEVESGEAIAALVDREGEVALPRQRFGRP